MEPYELYEKTIQQSFSQRGVDPLSGDVLAGMVGRFTEEIDRITSDMKRGLLRDRQILVVGGAGYIGSVLVRRLLRRGYKVKVLDNLLYGNGCSVSALVKHPDFSFLRGDFYDRAVLNRYLDGVTDVVLLASLVGDPICKKYPKLAKRTNEEATISLFNELNNHSINKFVFASTCSNYGLKTDGELATEEADLNPQSLYAETKVNVERHILNRKDDVEFCPTVLRVSTAYGLSSRMRFDLTVSEFVRELVTRKKVCVYDEDTWRPYCHVDDISEAIIKVIESPKEKVSGEVFNVGSSDGNYTKKMIVETILSYLKEGEIDYQEGGFDRRDYRVSFDKVFRELGFQNRRSINQAVPNLIDAIRNGLFDDVESRKSFYGNYLIPGAE